MRCDSAPSLLGVDSSLRLCAREWVVCCVRRGAVCVEETTSARRYAMRSARAGERSGNTHNVRQVEWHCGNRDSQHCSAADGGDEVSYDAQLILVDNVREAGDGNAGDELLLIRAAASASTSHEATTATERRRGRTIRARATFRTPASQITPMSHRRTKRCHGGRTTATW